MNTTRNLISGEGEALPFSTLPLWQWAATRITDPPPPMPRAVSYLTRRFAISPTYAALAASLSGLGGMNHE
jgi:hypothetical protein